MPDFDDASRHTFVSTFLLLFHRPKQYSLDISLSAMLYPVNNFVVSTSLMFVSSTIDMKAAFHASNSVLSSP